MPFTFIPNAEKPRNIFSLNGTWQITGGTAEQPENFSSTITVPSVVDTAEPPYDWLRFQYHWYRTAFRVKQHSSAQNYFLKISQSMFGTKVWLNGSYLGGSISCYTSHEYLLNKALRFNEENELLIRVGAKEMLPPESAVGRDQEKEQYTPGIWGDVDLIITGAARVKLVQVISHIDTELAEVRTWIENNLAEESVVTVFAGVQEKKSQRKVSPMESRQISVAGNSTAEVIFQLPIEAVQRWSPDHPFLYEAVIHLQQNNQPIDECRTTFGMREFKIIGADFFLNGKKILLRGGNIAFHRFLSDSQRKLLPWNEAWIKKLFIDIPKAHNFNFFRNHLGQLYNRWYDVADEYGMLVQNEWHFWGATGSSGQIRKEFTEWLHDNWNHPCIVIWDPLNESSDETIQREIVPEMKQLDPTRPWESVDFLEEHPYIYSLGMVLNHRKFGFSRSLQELEQLPVPSMINEFLWWWCNNTWEPTILTKEIVERWLGKNYSTEELIAHQSFLAQELIELFRRLRIKAIQPFVYLSNNDGPTAHWFLGDIKDLQPKPVLSAVKNAFAPFGVSIELWDRHFFESENRSVNIFVFNDSPKQKEGILSMGITTSSGEWKTKKEIPMSVDAAGDVVVQEQIVFPSEPGKYFLRGEIIEEGICRSYSKKICYVFKKPEPVRKKSVILFDPSNEIDTFLRKNNIPIVSFENSDWSSSDVLFINGRVFSSPAYCSKKKEIESFVRNGGTLILNEPEFRLIGAAECEIIPGIMLKISQRDDIDKGGYDSYVFAEDPTHALWHNIEKDHLKLLNGACGGEMVSEYTVEFSLPSHPLARCGMQLNIHAVSELHVGKGKIILNRIQLRGRLTPSDSSYTELYARRPDPVAQQFLFNLLSLS